MHDCIPIQKTDFYLIELVPPFISIMGAYCTSLRQRPQTSLHLHPMTANLETYVHPCICRSISLVYYISVHHSLSHFISPHLLFPVLKNYVTQHLACASSVERYNKQKVTIMLINITGSKHRHTG